MEVKHQQSMVPAASVVPEGQAGQFLQVANMFVPMLQTLQMNQQRMMASMLGRDSLPSLRSLSILGVGGGTRRQRPPPPDPIIEVLTPRHAAQLALPAQEPVAAEPVEAA